MLVVLVEFEETEETIEEYAKINKNRDYNGTILKSDQYYYDLFFGSGKTVKDYFYQVSGGRITMVPAIRASENEHFNVDGVVRLKLDFPHPNNSIDLAMLQRQIMELN
ncbi:MAG: hypothetical protein GX383_10495 [Clostridium sp.]|nr:hypothetical protein [Clostridium sp.]